MQKNKKSYISKLIITSICITCMVSTFGSHKKDLSLTNKQEIEIINTNAKLFEANLNVMQDPTAQIPTILKHNGLEPIYVVIADDFNENFKNIIIESLNYFENIFKKINNKYRFEIVNNDQATKHKKNKKTVIFYKNTDLDNTVALANCESYCDNMGRINEATINIDQEYLRKYSEPHLDNAESCLNTCNHELLHAFGFNDVYGDEIEYSSTLMSSYSLFNQTLSPHDFRVLLSAYYESTDSNNNFHEQLKLIDEYEKTYYEFHTKKYWNTVETTDQQSNQNKYEFEIEYPSLITTLISINDYNYSFTQFDEEGNIINTCSGKIKTINNQMKVLQNVKTAKSEYLIYNPYLSKFAITEIIIIDNAYKLMIIDPVNHVNFVTMKRPTLEPNTIDLS